MTAISCSDFLAEMGNLLEDDVAAELRAHLEAHLAECRACSVLFDSTRKTIRILTDTAVFELPPAQFKSGTDEIMARIRALAEDGP